MEGGTKHLLDRPPLRARSCSHTGRSPYLGGLTKKADAVPMSNAPTSNADDAARKPHCFDGHVPCRMLSANDMVIHGRCRHNFGLADVSSLTTSSHAAKCDARLQVVHLQQGTADGLQRVPDAWPREPARVECAGRSSHVRHAALGGRKEGGLGGERARQRATTPLWVATMGRTRLLTHSTPEALVADMMCGS